MIQVSDPWSSFLKCSTAWTHMLSTQMVFYNFLMQGHPSETVFVFMYHLNSVHVFISFFFCAFSFISRNLCVVWPFSPLFSILHWFPLICCHSDSFLFMCGWICESVGLRCSPSCTPCPLCDFLVVNVPGPPPQKKKCSEMSLLQYMCCAWENPFTWSHFMLYIFENYFEMCFFSPQK